MEKYGEARRQLAYAVASVGKPIRKRLNGSKSDS